MAEWSILPLTSAESEISLPGSPSQRALSASPWVLLTEVHSLRLQGPSAGWRLQAAFPVSVPFQRWGCGSCCARSDPLASWAPRRDPVGCCCVCLCRACAQVGVPRREPCKEGNQSACIHAEKPPLKAATQTQSLNDCASLQRVQLDY